MADIELVIKLDEEYIKQIDRIRFLIGGKEDRSLQINVINAIKNGTPLSKGHGRLIDADDLRLDIIGHKYSNNFCEEHNIDWSINLGMLNILLADAPTIIEADREENI